VKDELSGYKRVNKVNLIGPIFKLIPDKHHYTDSQHGSKIILVNEITKQYTEIRTNVIYFHPPEVRVKVRNKNYILSSSGLFPKNVEIKVKKDIYLIRHEDNYVGNPGEYFIKGKTLRFITGRDNQFRLAGLFTEDRLIGLIKGYFDFYEVCAVFRKKLQYYTDYVGLRLSTGRIKELCPKYRTNVVSTVLAEASADRYPSTEILIQDGRKICSRYLVFNNKYKNKLISPLFVKMLASRGCFIGPSFVLGERKDSVDGEECRVRVTRPSSSFSCKAIRTNDKLYIDLPDPLNPDSKKYIEVVKTGIEPENLRVVEHGKDLEFTVCYG